MYPLSPKNIVLLGYIFSLYLFLFDDVVKSLKHCLNVCVLGTFVFYCTTPLHCCDYVRVISLHTLRVFLIKSAKIQYFDSDLVTFTEKIFNGKLHLCPVVFAKNF